MKVLINSMAHFKLDSISNQDIFLLKRRLTIVPRADSFNQNPEHIFLYQENLQHNYISIPREYFLKVLSNQMGEYQFVDKTSMGYSLTPLTPIKLRPPQIPVVNQVIRALKSNPIFGGGLLNAETGFGKTITGIEIARRLGVTTIIKVYKDGLADQWVERINQFFPDAKIGRIQGDTFNYKNCDFVIAMVQTLCSRKNDIKKDDELRNYFGFEITDEVHRFGSHEWGSVADLFHCKYRLGLSATLRRKDNCENVFRFHIGGIVATGSGVAMTPLICFVESGYRDWSNKDINSRPVFIQLKALYKNTQRNKLIASKVVQASKANRNILILSKYTKHLQLLKYYIDAAIYLEQNENLNKKKIGYYIGALYTGHKKRTRSGKEIEEKVNQTKEELEEAVKADIILATYKMAEDAFDVPHLDVLIMAMPISDPIQSVGRVLRVADNKKQPIVIDICDDFLSLCRGLRKKRVQYYSEKNWPFKRIRQGGDDGGNKNN